MSDLRMPAEWTPHERTLVAWPTRLDTWRGTGLEEGRRCHAEVIDAIAQFEPVTVIADPADADDARRSCTGDGADVLALPIDDSWIRDSGPIIVRSGGDRIGVDFDFNGWGGKFAPFDKDRAVSKLILDNLGVERQASSLVLEGGSITVDGEGLLITTEQCLLDESRNPDLPRGDIERALRDLLGAERIVWLGQGLLEDADTDGHVDNICAFIAPGRVLLQAVPTADPNRANMERNREILEREGLKVETLDLLPRTQRPGGGEPIAIPYLNFYFVNGGVVVPVAGLDPDMDAEALSRIGTLIPDREVVGVEALTLAFGGGGIHCITQQVPQA